MDNLHYKKRFDLWKKNKITAKNLLKLDKIQNLVAKCCKNTENIALRSLQILYTFVLRVEIVTTFEPELHISLCSF